MIRRITILSLVLSTLLISPAVQAAAIPVHEWSQRFGAAGGDMGNNVAVDASGNVFVTGKFDGSVSFGGATLVSAGGFADVFLAKYDANGVHQWSRRFGGTGADEGFGVAVDASGNVVVTGNFEFSVSFGGSFLGSAGSSDIFLAKYDPNGVHLWSKRFGSANAEQGYGVATDPSGNVIITGVFALTVSFGGVGLVSSGFNDIYLAKYDPSGAHLWSKRFGGTSADTGRVVASDASGNLLATGYFGLTVDFGGGPLASAGGADVYVAKFDASGAHVWSQRFGGVGPDLGDDIAVDASGNAIVTGIFSDTVDFGGGPMVSAGGGDAFLAKYDANGTHQWSNGFGDASDQEGNGVAVDAGGNVALIGQFEGTVDFGGGALANVGGAYDIFIAKYDASGTHEWSQRFGWPSHDFGLDVAAYPTDGVVMTGWFTGTVDFGGGPLTSFAGSPDVFLVRIGEEDAIPVLFSSFEATARGNAVDVTWSFSSDEALDRFELYRTHGESSPDMVASGDVAIRSYTDRAVESGKTYAYELVVHSADGDVFRSPIATAKVGAMRASLAQNVPNPFNPRTSIEYVVDVDAVVSIEIFDATGAMVTRLNEGARTPGTYRVEWDGRDSAGRDAASGVYFYRLAGLGVTESRKMVLLK